jgi:hypothetical protein
MAMYGNVWQCMAMYGNVEMYGNVWQCRNVWQRMEIWQYMAIYGNLWQCICKFMAIWRCMAEIWPCGNTAITTQTVILTYLV